MEQQLLFDPTQLKKFESDWVLPKNFPDLSGAKAISIDLETNDPGLVDSGPGTRRGSYIAGVAVGTDDGFREYYPVAHLNAENLDSKQVFRWLKKELSGNQVKVGANLIYDLEFLRCADVRVNGPLYDIQVAEPLIDENQKSYSLEAIANKYLKESKTSSEMYEWLSYVYGGKPVPKFQGGRIHKAPPALVAKYAIGDVDLPLRIMEHQQRIMRQEGLEELFKMESELIPMLLDMRMLGVRINVHTLEKAIETTNIQIKELAKKLGHVDIWSAESLAKLFRKEGVDVRLTDKGNPSVTADWLEHQKHPVTQMVLEARKLHKFLTTFLEGSLHSKLVGGRIYSQFNQLKSDDFGTISGRFSSKNPNLQFIPGRDPVMTPLIRGMFIPEDGCQWVKDDYSQVEYRIITHYGTGPSAIEAQRAYNYDPRTDFHEFVANMCQIERKPAKTINFGIAYGMGTEALADKLNVSYAEADKLMDIYNGKFPFVKELSAGVANVASSRGYIKTILGRRARFDQWESVEWGAGPAMEKEKAIRTYGRVKRARTSTAFNRLIQGSAADIMKLAMRDIHKSGVMEVLHAPHLTVHDELDWSINLNDPKQNEAHKEVLHIMENCIKLKIPLVCDSEVGPDWGHVK